MLNERNSQLGKANCCRKKEALMLTYLRYLIHIAALQLMQSN